MKNPLNRLVVSSLKKHITQNIAAILMMSLSFCFVTAATLLFVSHEQQSAMETYQQFSAAQALLLDAKPGEWEAMKNAFPIYKAGQAVTFAAHDLGEEYSHLSITLGAMDETALAMSGFTLISGSWPRENGDIAISDISLMRLGANTKVGEHLSLNVTPLGSGRDTVTQTRVFRIAGIFSENTDEWADNMSGGYFYNSDLTAYSFDTLPTLETIPTVLLPFTQAMAESALSPGARTSYLMQFSDGAGHMTGDLGLKGLNENIIAPYLRSLPGMPYFVRNSRAYAWYDRQWAITAQLLRMALIITIGGLSVLLLGSGIAASFEMRLNERRQQIGLIRAIGASRGQAIRLALMEALALLMPSLLLGIGLGSLIARICLNRLAAITGRPFPAAAMDAGAMLAGLAICFAFLCFFALRPMMRLTKKSPVALLHLQLTKQSLRIMRKRRIPKNPLRLLHTRFARLHSFRHIFPILTLSACLAMAILAGLIYTKNVRQNDTEEITEDQITMQWGRNGSNWETPLTDFNLGSLSPQHWKETSNVSGRIADQIKSIPGITSAVIAKHAASQLLFLLPEQVTDYVKYSDNDNNPMNGDTLVIRQNAAKHMGMPDDMYIWNPASLIWPEAGILGLEEENLLALEPSLMAGSIDLRAIRSGEAVLLGASSYIRRPVDKYGWETVLTNDRTGGSVYKNNAFQAGDTITFGKVYIYNDNGVDKLKAVTHTARICGLVNRNPGSIFTTADRFSTWEYPDGITYIQLRLPVEESYDEAYRKLVMLSRQYSFYMYSDYQNSISSRRSLEGSVFLYQTILLLLTAMGLALLVGNTLSRLSIREQEVSLFRAVGMDGKKVKRLLYGEAVRDGIWAAVWGTVLGMLFCGLYNHLSSFAQEEEVFRSGIKYYVSLVKGVPLAPTVAAFVLFPLTGLAVSAGWIGRLLKRSIVAGIRQTE
jgi:ABC-type lipoprotein release transport system permease subunit